MSQDDLQLQARYVADALVDSFKEEHLYSFLCRETNELQSLYRRIAKDLESQDAKAVRESELNPFIPDDSREPSNDQIMQHFFDRLCTMKDPSKDALRVGLATDLEQEMHANDVHMMNFILKVIDDHDNVALSRSIRQTHELKSILRRKLNSQV